MLFYNCNILYGDQLELITDGALEVEGDRIKRVGQVGQFDPSKSSVDLGGSLVIPSFVNAHVHVGDVGLKDRALGIPPKRAVFPSDGLKYSHLQSLGETELRMNLEKSLNELLNSGVTAFGDFREGGAEGVDALFELADKLPIKPVVLGEIPSYHELISSSDVEVRNDTLEQETGAVLRNAHGIGLGDISFFDDDLLGTLEELTGNKLLAFHLAETEEAQNTCQEKRNQTEIERGLASGVDLVVHATNATGEDLRLLEDCSRPKVVLCPRTNALLGDGLPPVHEFLNRNIPFALGTDNLMFTSPNMFREMDWASRLAGGLSKNAEIISSDKILKSATIWGAEALGIEKDLGSIQEGKYASFLAVDLNSPNLAGTDDAVTSLVHRATLEDVVYIMSLGGTVKDELSSS